MTIIGVIAAMTIPTLLSKYQSHVQLTALKKAYSNLQNAVKMLPISLNCGTDYDCVLDELGISRNSDNWDNQGFNKALAKQFKYTEIGEHTQFDDVGNINYGYFITSDGMTWGIHNIGNTIDLTVDTNSTKKGPNKSGKDVFRFDIALNTQNGVPAGTVMPRGSKIYSEYYNNDDRYYWRNRNDGWISTGKALELDKIDE